ncbi:hypothetical protein BD626DRAFT_395406 [Schizophyllum amplum]|uniref:F-box domain-containing protein n=1 Tax=Schizophyllum amplum TaxID=97359 RepID=A0A550CRG6_9AGAR|nr:hypothetical protein BD626DRAFT_395406 [Auriculariopsis ampla]
MICDSLTSGSDIAADGTNAQNRRALARLAVCCRTTSLPALRALWRTVTEPTVIVKYTMPDGIWAVVPVESDDDEDDGDILVATRPIVPADLKRFMFYAPFIREMKFGWDVPLAVAEDSYSAICMACPAPVFPNLTRMGWDIDGPVLLYSRFFICPSLTSLHIVAGSISMGDVCILRCMPQQCPAITEFKLDLETATDAIIDALGEPICAWALRKLDVTHINQLCLVRLANSHVLEELNVENDQHKCGLSSLIDFPAGAFASLTSLRLGIPLSFTACISMLRASSFTALRVLAIHSLAPNPTRWGELFAAVRVAHTQPRLLRELILRDRLSDLEPISRGPEPDDVADSRFAPLYDFSQLEAVELSALDGFRLTDGVVESMARAWPNLRTLRIICRTPLSSPQLSLAALAHLASGCRSLASLEIDVNATGASLAQVPPEPFTPQSALRRLQLNWSTIKSARPVAAYLSCLFSNIEELTSVSRDEALLSTLQCPRWLKVGYLLPAFTAVREYAESRGTGEGAGRWKDFNDETFSGVYDQDL